MNRKPIFDAVRKLMGGRLTQADVDALDEACDLAESAIAGARKPAKHNAAAPANGWTLGKKGFALIKEFEGCERDLPDGTFGAYPDPGSADGRPWTIGWGSTGPDIKPGTIWTQAQCDARFEQDMQRYVGDVAKAIGEAKTSQNQFDALVSFHYNTGAIRTATLTKRHVEGRYAEAETEFGRWINNAGKPMKGLVRRRAAEAKLYRGN
jgi:lysozyme